MIVNEKAWRIVSNSGFHIFIHFPLLPGRQIVLLTNKDASIQGKMLLLSYLRAFGRTLVVPKLVEVSHKSSAKTSSRWGTDLQMLQISFGVLVRENHHEKTAGLNAWMWLLRQILLFCMSKFLWSYRRKRNNHTLSFWQKHHERTTMWYFFLKPYYLLVAFKKNTHHLPEAH